MSIVLQPIATHDLVMCNPCIPEEALTACNLRHDKEYRVVSIGFAEDVEEEYLEIMDDTGAILGNFTPTFFFKKVVN